MAFDLIVLLGLLCLYAPVWAFRLVTQDIPYAFQIR